MKVLFATSEAAPFAKTGGLGDVCGSLPLALNEEGADVRVIMPLYRCIPAEYKTKMQYINHIYIDLAWRKQYCGIFKLVRENCTYYFIDNEFYFGGHKPYGYIHEDVEKFAFFSKAALSVLPTIDFRPDIIHCHDWQTGAIPVYLDTFQNNPFYRGIKTIMTIHNLKFQGRWGMEGIKDVMGIDSGYFTSDKLEYYKDANLLKGGIVYADKITTVSETYAHEITTPEYGEGLNGLLWARRNDLSGILNGISYEEYNPETDPYVYENYTAENAAEKKKINKVKLQQELNLPQDENRFMIGIVSRLTEQKGFDILAQALERLCNDCMQIVVLGTGEPRFENMFRHFAWKYPDKLSANIYFSNELAHRIYAGCDALLMPSRFEPCGLSQLISLRYGTLPIVRETGGLKDTVIAYNEYTGEGTGFSFSQYLANDMQHVLWYAKSIYCDRDCWNDMMRNAMRKDFSWTVSAKKYICLYENLTGISLSERGAKKDEKLSEEKTPEITIAEVIFNEINPEIKEDDNTFSKKLIRRKKTDASQKAESEKKSTKKAAQEKDPPQAEKAADKKQKTAKPKKQPAKETAKKSAKETAAAKK